MCVFAEGDEWIAAVDASIAALEERVSWLQAVMAREDNRQGRRKDRLLESQSQLQELKQHRENMLKCQCENDKQVYIDRLHELQHNCDIDTYLRASAKGDSLAEYYINFNYRLCQRCCDMHFVEKGFDECPGCGKMITHDEYYKSREQRASE